MLVGVLPPNALSIKASTLAGNRQRSCGLLEEPRFRVSRHCLGLHKLYGPELHGNTWDDGWIQNSSTQISLDPPTVRERW